MSSKTTITAPMPGVFYRRPDPDEDPYAETGDRVESGDVVGTIGVMKNFHEVTAGANGVVGEFLVEDETEIEAGDPIVDIESE